MKVLIADDSKTMRLMLANIMRSLNFEVFEASDGRQALDRLREPGSVDLFLVDWNMPDMNGLECIKAVKKIPELQKMLIMMITTETEMDNVVQAMEAGANEYVMKPFTRELFIGKLELMGLHLELSEPQH